MAPVEFDLQPTAESLARWRIGRDGPTVAAGPADARVPMSWLVFLRAQPILGLNFHELLERDPDRGLYGGVNYRLLAPLSLGERLRATSEVQARKTIETARGPMVITTFLTTYRQGSELRATEAVRMIDLPAAAPAQPAEARKASRAPVQPRVAALPAITRSQVAWLTVETGDTNPLHLDLPYAVSRGYRDVVVPATLISAMLERELEAVAGSALVELDIRYHAPTFPDESIELFAASEGDQLRFEAFVGASLRADGQARLRGSA